MVYGAVEVAGAAEVGVVAMAVAGTPGQAVDAVAYAVQVWAVRPVHDTSVVPLAFRHLARLVLAPPSRSGS